MILSINAKSTPELLLQSRAKGTVAVLTFRGRLRREQLPAAVTLFKNMLESHGRQVVVDLSHATHLSSAAIALVFYYHKLMHDRGGRLILVRPFEEVRSRLPGIGFEGLFDCHDALEDAVLAAQRGSQRPTD